MDGQANRYTRTTQCDNLKKCFYLDIWCRKISLDSGSLDPSFQSMALIYLNEFHFKFRLNATDRKRRWMVRWHLVTRKMSLGVDWCSGVLRHLWKSFNRRYIFVKGRKNRQCFQLFSHSLPWALLSPMRIDRYVEKCYEHPLFLNLHDGVIIPAGVKKF